MKKRVCRAITLNIKQVNFQIRSNTPLPPGKGLGDGPCIGGAVWIGQEA
jgi:hypothetical protein